MAMTAAERKKKQRANRGAPTAEVITKTTMELFKVRLWRWCNDTTQPEPGLSGIAHEVAGRFPIEHSWKVQHYLGIPYYDPDDHTNDYEDHGLWDRLRQRATDLVYRHQAAAEEAGAPGPDAAWRALMRDILAAVTDSFDGDEEAAVGALATALREVSGEPAE